MKWTSYIHQGELRFGYLVEDFVQSVTNKIFSNVLTDREFEDEGSPIPRCEVIFRSPVEPGKIVCIGANYYDHCREVRMSVPKSPVISAKFCSSLAFDGAAIECSRELTRMVDYEAELGVIIGKRAYRIREANARDYIFGYVVANDITARDLQQKDGQWVRAKSLQNFCPVGSTIVTVEEVSDHQNLAISCKLNGKVVQSSNTNNMIFSINYLISYLSKFFPLDPGDLILTGTPSGTGAGQRPQKWLQHNDQVEIEIEKIGFLKNSFLHVG